MTRRIRTVLIVVLFMSNFVFAQQANTIGEIETPQDFTRIVYASDSYPSFLRALPLKENNEIRKWDGKRLRSSWMLYDVLAVLDVPLLYNEDLEQCADFSMRLWSEYLKAQDQLDKLALFDYNGIPKPYTTSGRTFESYLRWHMAYSNSYSIKKGAQVVLATELQPGNMFVQNTTGGIGHVSVIVDAAVNAKGDKVFLVGFGYMPAQEFHIEQADTQFGPQGWFTLEGYLEFLDGLQFNRYGKPILMRYN